MQPIICHARINGFIEAEGWFYNGCSEHHFKLRTFDGVDKCKRCGTGFVEKLCYRVVAIVNGNPDNIEEAADFILFDRQIEELSGGSDIKSDFPSRINELIGRSFTFTVKLNSDIVKNDRPDFTATYLEDPLELTDTPNSLSKSLLPSSDKASFENP